MTEPHVSRLCDQGDHEKCAARVCACTCHEFAKRAALERIRAMRESLKEGK